MTTPTSTLLDTMTADLEARMMEIEGQLSALRIERTKLGEALHRLGSRLGIAPQLQPSLALVPGPDLHPHTVEVPPMNSSPEAEGYPIADLRMQAYLLARRTYRVKGCVQLRLLALIRDHGDGLTTDEIASLFTGAVITTDAADPRRKRVRDSISRLGCRGLLTSTQQGRMKAWSLVLPEAVAS